MNDADLTSMLAQRTGARVMASPYVEERWANLVMKDKTGRNDAQNMLEMARRLGCELIYAAEGGVDFVSALPDLAERCWKVSVTPMKDGLESVRSALKTPYGELTCAWVMDRQAEDPSSALTESLLKEEHDYEALNWYLDQVGERLDILVKLKSQYVAAYRRQYGAGRILESDGQIPCALHGWLKRDDLIVHQHLWPETFSRTALKLHKLEQALMIAALESGANMIRFCVEGRERFTREMFERDLLPMLHEDVDLVHQHGAFSYIHTCGHMRDQLNWGYLNQLKPHLVESFSELPEGDVDDLKRAREMVAPAICTRGNISLTLLRHGTPAEVERATRKVIEAVGGFRHIVSGTDAVFAGTPFENVKAMVTTVKTFGGSH